ncbi:Gas vesicle synthesis protein GvpL/GvpF [Rhodococcus rhodochrous J3]|uniref:Gas vesicle synthesis protein GvpL/GvpF n=1 Tax=Rhodococcus rhodochrous J3 TaxID=903528 RepID=A0ABY1M861_RHORH|nr:MULTISPECIES: GvpL/GvpF family gas vesicle protein [Rhodococcus]AYA24485.1 gas vesicle protein GvpFL [Rhodococcus rhodochrous]MBF4480464.1 GvpL/GvpF family gas vesicle protein [Rhodococcus rhodochrous]MCB8911534.1 GvpL/GvpF family gas vesicle protein [Rhodococcus rhodochrous]MCD2099742.1 GvpL/GvpF family gas vesicle protein [Rhodococcus rhodochrous]MCD2124126.1 GvpL/GvpF family gas vesicle protein [Rhodococcus rhodochrous]
MTDTTGIWMYAVTDGTLVGHETEGTSGVAGEQVRTVQEGGLTAVVGTVPLDDFGEAALARNLEDLDWLERVARAHDSVVAGVARHVSVVPLRLATVCLDDERVRALLTEHREQFSSALALVTGRTEWGVKAFADRKALTAAVAEAQTEGAGSGTGTAYLLRRRAQLAAQESVERDAAARAAEIHERLLRVSAAGRRGAPTDPALSGSHEWMLLNGTYLVDDDRTDEFRSEVEELASMYTGIRLETSGPWPPYSFAGAERISP